MFTTSDWHRRFSQQARWTAELRQYAYSSLPFATSARVLEIGCGTGVILASLHRASDASIHGLDIRRDSLNFARAHLPSAHLTAGDAFRLPYVAGIFDICLCHFLFLWLSNPAKALSEMIRVTRPGGYLLALAEPDYGGRIDHPADLVRLGQLQGQAINQQGADPNMGRKLAGLFHASGLTQIQTGLLGGHWSNPPSHEVWESEWAVLSADLAGAISDSELTTLREMDAAAWQHGERILFVPTFFAWGRVPEILPGQF